MAVEQKQFAPTVKLIFLCAFVCPSDGIQEQFAPTVKPKPYKCRGFCLDEKGNQGKNEFLCLNIHSASEICLYFGSQQSIIAVIVFDYVPLLEECYAAAYIEGVGEVV